MTDNDNRDSYLYSEFSDIERYIE